MAQLDTNERPLAGGETPLGAAGAEGAVASFRRRLPQSLRTQAGVRLGRRLRGLFDDIGSGIGRMAAEEAAHGRAILFVPICLGLGAILWFEAAGDPMLLSLFLGLLLLAGCFHLARGTTSTLRPILAACALIVAGMLLAQLETFRAATVVLDSAVTTTITGKVERREADGAGRWRYLLAVKSTEDPRLGRPPERISLTVRSGAAFEIGETMTGRARLSPPSGPALPRLNDFAFSAYFDGIGAVGYLYGAPKRVQPAGVSTDPEEQWEEAVADWLYRLRSGIGDRIRSVLPGDTGAFAAALVTDERRAISDETTEALRLSGLAHIIAISGLNMALSAGIFFVGFRSLLSLSPYAAEALPGKKIAAAGALLAVTAYFLISGFAVSAERAFIMMAIMLAAVFFDRPSLSLRNVALSAIVIVALAPSEVLGPSFQMSYAATLALVAGYAIWKERPANENAVAKMMVLRPFVLAMRFFAGILLTSVIGGLSTAIFSIEHFHRLAAYGLAANLAAMPIISFIVMPAGLVAMLLMPFGLDSLPWQVTGFGLDLVILVAKTVAGWGGNVGIGRQPAWFFSVAVAGFLVLTLLRTRLRWAGAFLMAAAVLGVALAPSAPRPDIVISEDGRLVALVRDEALHSNRERPPSFIFSQWQRALALNEHRPPKIVAASLPAEDSEPTARRVLAPEEGDHARSALRAAQAESKNGGFVCEKKAWCTARLQDGRSLTVIDDVAYLGPACDTADIVVTAARLRLDRCRSGALLFTAQTLRRTGAIEIRFVNGEPEITTALGSLARPWQRHRTYDWRSGQFLEASEVENDLGPSDNDE
ncbi:ComEC/Rec2 family competence protein [Rhizobium sp. BK251]|uniref:ComEC/Rec2 family competence protein n=1 Tax=Rhizobium sp. BK251 TaxID=2512125 RepID=UPI001049E41B|nr:ComEC/Rec2 family competence protein [Rhizobium sp. BK251]TCL74010.1 ComEC/Rec2-related protein [Rhizobium sp. BK251]